MKQITSILFTVIAIFVITNVQAQEAVYVNHNEAYMDKYQYKVENLSAYNSHIAYHIYTSNTEKIILNIALSSYTTIQNSNLNKVQEISSINWNSTLINEINNDLKSLYLVFEEDNTFKQYLVSSAIYVQESEEKLMYSGPYYSYNFEKNKTYNTGVDLELGKFEIYDEAIFMTSTEAEDMSCIKTYSFIKIIKETHPKNSFTMIANNDFTKLQTNEIYETCQSALYIDYLENVGIVEERTKNGSIKLIGINNQPINEYVGRFCQTPESYNAVTNNSTQPIETTGQPGLNFKTRSENTEKSGEKLTPTENVSTTTTNESEYELIYTMLSTSAQTDIPSIYQPTPEITTPTITTTNPTETMTEKNGSIVHVVDNGETLYSISKKYNTSVSELQTLNNIADTGIFVTQRLIIKQ